MLPVRMRGAFDIVLASAHLRKTLKIALVVGGVLIAINATPRRPRS